MIVNRPSLEPCIKWAVAWARSCMSALLAILLHHPRRADVAVLADERVDFRLLAEPLQAGRDDDQLAAVGQRHPRAIDRLVRHPRAEELVALHDAHDFLQSARRTP